MSRFGPQRRKQQRRADRELREDFRNATAWRYDSAEDVVEEQETEYPAPGITFSQRRVVAVRDSLILEFAVTVKFQGSELLCIDTCNHGTVHRHRDGDHESDPDVIAEIVDRNTVHAFYWDAVSEAYDLIINRGDH